MIGDYSYETSEYFTYQNDAIFTGIFEKGGTSYVYEKGGIQVYYHQRLAMSILIAEDNVAQRAYLREILEREFQTHTLVQAALPNPELISIEACTYSCAIQSR